MQRERKTAERREQIVMAAMACFIHKGFHQSSMRDIAEAAGVSLGNLYNHFTGKEALIAEIAALEAGELQPLLHVLAHEAPAHLLPDFCRGYLAICSQRENVMLTAEILAEAARQPALARLFAANRQQLHQALLAGLQRMAEAGLLRQGLTASAVLADLILDAIEGLAMRRHLFTDEAAEPGLLGLLAALLSD